MKLNLNTTIKNLQGEPFKNEGKDVTIKEVLETALLVGSKQEDSDEEKYKRFKLVNEIYQAKETIELKSDQIIDLKKLVYRAYPNILICGQVDDILES
jgi:hypothetical protein